MRVRKAKLNDLGIINKLIDSYKFNLDTAHLTSTLIVESDTGKIIAFGSLVTLLESMFVTDPSVSKRERLIALKLLVNRSNEEVKKQGYESYHGYVEHENVEKLLIKHFKFVKVIGNNLIRWIS